MQLSADSWPTKTIAKNKVVETKQSIKLEEAEELIWEAEMQELTRAIALVEKNIVDMGDNDMSEEQMMRMIGDALRKAGVASSWDDSNAGPHANLQKCGASAEYAASHVDVDANVRMCGASAEYAGPDADVPMCGAAASDADEAVVRKRRRLKRHRSRLQKRRKTFMPRCRKGDDATEFDDATGPPMPCPMIIPPAALRSGRRKAKVMDIFRRCVRYDERRGCLIFLFAQHASATQRCFADKYFMLNSLMPLGQLTG